VVKNLLLAHRKTLRCTIYLALQVYCPAFAAAALHTSEANGRMSGEDIASNHPAPPPGNEQPKHIGGCNFPRCRPVGPLQAINKY